MPAYKYTKAEKLAMWRKNDLETGIINPETSKPTHIRARGGMVECITPKCDAIPAEKPTASETEQPLPDIATFAAQCENERDIAQAHAEALAEALRDMVAGANRVDVKMRDAEIYAALPGARQALAAWEGAK